MIDLAAAGIGGVTGIASGNNEASWRNIQVQQQNRQQAMQEQQQQFQQALAVQQFQKQAQQQNLDAQIKIENLRQLREQRQSATQYKEKALAQQLEMSNNRLLNQQGIADQRNAYNYDKMNLDDAHFQQKYGLDKAKFEEVTSYHDAQLAQGDQRMQSLDAWRQQQLQAGANKAEVDRVYHQGLLELKARAAAKPADTSTAERQAITQDLTNMRQRSGQLNQFLQQFAGVNLGTLKPDLQSQIAAANKERIELERKMNESVTKLGTTTAPANTPATVKPLPEIQPVQQGGAVRSVVTEVAKQPAAANQQYTPEQAISKLVQYAKQEGKESQLAGGTVDGAIQKYFNQATFQKRELTDVELKALVDYMGKDAIAYLKKQGYDSRGVPVKG